jgi:hypothetical protein
MPCLIPFKPSTSHHLQLLSPETIQQCLTATLFKPHKSRHFHVHIMSKTIERLRKMLKNYPKLPATNQKLSISRKNAVIQNNFHSSTITQQFHSPSHHVCMLICAPNSRRLTVHNNKKSMKTLKQKQVLASCERFFSVFDWYRRKKDETKLSNTCWMHRKRAKRRRNSDDRLSKKSNVDDSKGKLNWNRWSRKENLETSHANCALLCTPMRLNDTNHHNFASSPSHIRNSSLQKHKLIVFQSGRVGAGWIIYWLRVSKVVMWITTTSCFDSFFGSGQLPTHSAVEM